MPRGQTGQWMKRMADGLDYRLRTTRIGLIVPASNTNAEPDCSLLCPEGVTTHVTRSGGYDVEAIPDSDEMRRFVRQSIDQNCQHLRDARVDLVAYACTSATLADGPQFDAKFCELLSDKSGCPAVTTAGALVEAIRHLGVTRVAFTSPYVKRLSRESVEFLQQSGIEVVNEFALERELSSLEQNALTPQDAYDMALCADHPDAQAMVISCTDFRALEAVQAIESALQKPVITSNQALMFACLKRLGLPTESQVEGGYLFTGNGSFV